MGVNGLKNLNSDSEDLSSLPVASYKSDEVIDEIRRLEEQGILGRELCPEPGYWHWDVLKLDELPERFKQMYEELGEIRW